ncbi:MAG: type II secretion system protein [Planctomycetota bacterium]|jgi:prepilin-type N-terminal cleavage/methylation domain-containing protein
MKRTDSTHGLSSRTCRHAGAFTLVELLVVIAIISVLAGLLLPALQNAIDSARTIACASRLKQTMLAVQIYEQEFNAIIPTTIGEGNHHGGNMIGQQVLYEAGVLDREHVLPSSNWAAMVEENVAPLRGSSVLLCPGGKRFDHMGTYWKTTMSKTDPERYLQTGYGWWGYRMHASAGSAPGDPSWYNGTPYASIFYDYGINFYLKKAVLRPELWLNGREWQALKALETPASKTVYMLENGLNAKCVPNYMKGVFTVEAHYAFRHGETTNYACYDGHVGSLNKGHFLNFDVMPLADAQAELPFMFK